MRIDSTSSSDLYVRQPKISTTSHTLENTKAIEPSKENVGTTDLTLTPQLTATEKEAKVDEAIKSINEFLETTHKTSKFIKHEGLDKYYVRLVDADTDEVIKEIPPEKLLDAFYEMKKLLGMIVDEKI